jgi:hypothetical protein
MHVCLAYNVIIIIKNEEGGKKILALAAQPFTLAPSKDEAAAACVTGTGTIYSPGRSYCLR